MYIKKKLGGYEEMRKMIRAGETVYTERDDRKIGKTTLLIAEAKRTGAALCVPEYRQKEIKEEYPEVKVVAGGEYLRGACFPEGLLIDEGPDSWEEKTWEAANFLRSNGDYVSGFRKG